jgi:hypothetical protein
MTLEEFKEKQAGYLRSLCILKEMPEGRKVVLSQEACSLLEIDMKGELHVGAVAEFSGKKQVSARCVTTAGVLREKIAAAGHDLKSPRDLLKEDVKRAEVSDSFKRPAPPAVKAPAPQNPTVKAVQ